MEGEMWTREGPQSGGYGRLRRFRSPLTMNNRKTTSARRDSLLNRECFAAPSKIHFQLVCAVDATPIAMHYDNVVGAYGCKPVQRHLLWPLPANPVGRQR